jgi:hypothetical protein
MTPTTAPAPYGGEKSVTVIYGPSSLGKTTDVLYSFPNGLFLAPPGALKPAHNVVGHVPASAEASTIEDATKRLREAAKTGKYDSVIVDDFSLLSEQTVAHLENVKKLSGFKLWGVVRDHVLEFRDTARRCGMHVVLIAHESAPRTVNGTFVRGGPKLPGRLPEDLPTACDTVLRAAHDTTRKGWHASYRCTVDDPQWVLKDRHGVTPDRAPMNLAEILRAAGYEIRRAVGLEWQEPIVEALSNALVADPANAATYLAEGQGMAGNHTENPLHIRWVLRDALDRAALTRARQNVYALYL